MGERFRIAANAAGIFMLAVLLLAPASGLSQNGPMPSALDAAARADTVSRLYFGRTMAGGGQVTERDWATFLTEVVTPRFPDGFTTWPAQGQWREKSGAIVQEPAFVFEIVHPADTRTVDAIKTIVAEYKRRFRQEAVLWIRGRVETSF